MNTFYYPASRLWPDYLRVGLGLIACLGLLLFASPQSVIFALLTGLSLLFAWLGAMTLWRQQIEVELDPSGIASRSRWGGGRRRKVMPWSDITSIDLRFYSTRRDRSEGWLQLTIKGRNARLRVDSDLAGFPQLVRQVLAAADRMGIPVTAPTRANASRLSGQAERREGRP